MALGWFSGNKMSSQRIKLTSVVECLVAGSLQKMALPCCNASRPPDLFTTSPVSFDDAQKLILRAPQGSLWKRSWHEFRRWVTRRDT